MLYQGDCQEVLKTLDPDSIDSLITDPPAGISFMNKEWDSGNNFIPAMTEIFKECLRVMKPGAHGLIWALPRTSHWTATALETAGFEIRDVITHLFGSGFPKSLNLGNGRGTALKPASEHWILVRKPISEKTIAGNVLKHGTGGINIDASRIELSGYVDPRYAKNVGGKETDSKFGQVKHSMYCGSEKGRFPANLVLDEVAAEMLDEQSGVLQTHAGKGEYGDRPISNTYSDGWKRSVNQKSDSGGASRFFYVAKASKKDRNEGLEGMPDKQLSRSCSAQAGNEYEGSGFNKIQITKNNHPTVKSTKLMEYLITLITPPIGVILDPFMGSGSTGKAAKQLGFEFIGIEKEQEYFEIAEKRIAHEAK